MAHCRSAVAQGALSRRQGALRAVVTCGAKRATYRDIANTPCHRHTILFSVGGILGNLGISILGRFGVPNLGNLGDFGVPIFQFGDFLGPVNL